MPSGAERTAAYRRRLAIKEQFLTAHRRELEALVTLFEAATGVAVAELADCKDLPEVLAVLRTKGDPAPSHDFQQRLRRIRSRHRATRLRRLKEELLYTGAMPMHLRTRHFPATAIVDQADSADPG